MTKPVRLQLQRRARFNLQRLSQESNGLACVNVARPSKWGNPFPIGGRVYDPATGGPLLVRDAAHAVALHRGWLLQVLDHERGGALTAALGYLRGRNLACWCQPGHPCHADVLLELANK